MAYRPATTCSPSSIFTQAGVLASSDEDATAKAEQAFLAWPSAVQCHEFLANTGRRWPTSDNKRFRSLTLGIHLSMSAMAMLRQLRADQSQYNRTMPDLSSEQFQRSLADTVAWCRMKAIGLDAEADDVRQRQALYAQAEQHWEEAQEAVKRGWLRRKITDTKQWQSAMALLKQIRDSLGPMDRKLRSPELKPSFTLDGFGDDALWAKAVAEVVASRSHLTVGPSAKKRDTNIGRLLLYTPSENLACGAAEASSNGFFDVNNVPPWDIWVDFSEGTLVSWVPPALLDVAQMGIYMNPEACIRWAT
jgi:hypothetical protein